MQQALGLLTLLSVVGMAGLNIVLPLHSAVAQSMGLPIHVLSATVTPYLLTFACSQLVGGPLSDGYGRVPLVWTGLGLFAAGSALCGVAQDLSLFTLGRATQGLGAGLASVLARAAARDLYAGEGLARALAMIMTIGAAAPALSPVVGTVLATSIGWRGSLALIAAASLVLALVYWLVLRETLPASRRVPVHPLQVGREYGRLLMDARFWPPALALAVAGGAVTTLFALVPVIGATQLHLDSMALGLCFSVTLAPVLVGGFAAPRMSRRFGSRVSVMVGGVCILLSGGALLMLPAPSLVLLGACLAPFLLGLGMLTPLAAASALSHFGAAAGRASAALGFLQLICAAAGLTLANALSQPPSSSLAVVFVIGGAVALAASSHPRAYRPPVRS